MSCYKLHGLFVRIFKKGTEDKIIILPFLTFLKYWRFQYSNENFVKYFTTEIGEQWSFYGSTKELNLNLLLR